MLTALGLAHPLGPVTISATMAVASATHRANGPFAANGGYELALTNLAAGLTLAAAGPGRYSLGAGLSRRLSRLVALGATTAAAANIAMMLLGPQPTSAERQAEPHGDEADEETRMTAP